MGAAPPDVEQALCGVCKEAAAQRCEECFDEEEGHLYLCAKDACFDAQHGIRESLRRKHRESLAVWNSKAKWTDKCCATHKGYLLALWCVDCSMVVCGLCCSHGEHTKHKTSLVIDTQNSILEQLEATTGQLEAENAKNEERLRKLKEEQDGLASGNGAVGDARRALEEVKALFIAKVDALSGELDETAARWSAQVAAEHEQLARHTRSVQSLVDDMRATCAGETCAEDAQRVAIACTELLARRDALGSSPPVPDRVLEFTAAPLRQAVADLSAHAIERVPSRAVCAACGSGVPEGTTQCDDCADAVREFEEGGGDLRYASKSLRAEKPVVLAAVAQFGNSLNCTTDELKADKDVVLVAVAQSGYALQYASDELRADKEVVLVAVAQDGDSLCCASEDLRADKEVVLVAVAENGESLEYAGNGLRADKDVVLAAVAQNGLVLDSVLEEFKDDKDVVLAAVAQNRDALKYACAKLQADKDVKRRARRR